MVGNHRQKVSARGDAMAYAYAHICYRLVQSPVVDFAPNELFDVSPTYSTVFELFLS